MCITLDAARENRTPTCSLATSRPTIKLWPLKSASLYRGTKQQRAYRRKFTCPLSLDFLRTPLTPALFLQPSWSASPSRQDSPRELFDALALRDAYPAPHASWKLPTECSMR